MPMMSDRDMCMKFNLVEQPDGGTIYTASTVDRPDYPVKKGVVRMEVFKLGKLFQVGEDIQMHEFASFNLGGYFP